jgi:hypothetical protein
MARLVCGEMTGEPIPPAGLKILMVGANNRPATAEFLGVASPLANGRFPFHARLINPIAAYLVLANPIIRELIEHS